MSVAREHLNRNTETQIPLELTMPWRLGGIIIDYNELLPNLKVATDSIGNIVLYH